MATLVLLPLFSVIHTRLEHPVLQWQWDHIGMPLLRTGLMILFIILSYPDLFGINDAPSIASLLFNENKRINSLINLLFLLTLIFPMVPVIGNWEEFILPLQGIVASMMIFTWLAHDVGLAKINYWPGLDTALIIVIIALITHWLANVITIHCGEILDEKFNVKYCGEFLSRAVLIFMQSPAILLFSLALGRQLQ